MTDPLFSVENRVVLVSGGSRGIGRSLAHGLAARGAQVIITGREADTLAATAKELTEDTRGATKPVVPLVCDVADEKAIERLVPAVLEKAGRIDVLVNVAGVNRRKKAEAFTPEDYDFILDINLRGAFLLAQAVGRQMIAQKKGVQVHIASLNTDRPLKGVLPYAMSKAGLATMTRGLALEWGQHGIRVNGIAPGFILTDLSKKLWAQPHMQAWNAQVCPLQRLGVVEDLVGACVYLASDASAFMTGQTLFVDGGMTAGYSWPIEL